MPCQLYHWDGNDGLPGVREPGQPPQAKVTLLGTIQAPAGAEPEGLVVLKDEPAGKFYEVMIVYDGIKGEADALPRSQAVSP